MMSLPDFKQSLGGSSPPAEVSPYLQSMWHDAKDDWNKAHSIIQNIEDKKAAWVHAYLHRKEGDIANADYWYRRAGKTRPNDSLETEWENIVEAML
jgi:hypothetical protein